jgi:hypothetical protein
LRGNGREDAFPGNAWAHCLAPSGIFRRIVQSAGL